MVPEGVRGPFMTDYYGALRDAVDSLPAGDRAGRRAFFNRARRLLIERLQTANPPVPARELRAELAAFDAAAKEIELELAPAPAPAGRRSAPPVRSPSSPSRPAAPAAPPVGPVSRSPAPQPVAPRPPAAPPVPDPGLAIPAEDVALAVPETAAPVMSSRGVRMPNSKRPASRSPLGVTIGIAAILLLGGAALFWWSGQETSAPRRPTLPAATQSSSARPAEPANLQYILRRQLVYYRTIQPPGTIVIAKSQHFLYIVQPNSVGLRYTFGMGSGCAELGGLYKISRKDGDTQNPKDAALGIGETSCRIRQIDRVGAIGQNLRSPGIQLAGDDFVDLFDHVDPDTRVVVAN
jgi:lipoprotein-anchoring transpeptidase ErfK/SrfK